MVIHIFLLLFLHFTTANGISCYQCDIVYNISDCHHVQTCPGADDLCYTDVNVPNTQFETFSLGCRTRSQCTLASPSVIIGRKRDTPRLGCNQCCASDRCHAKLCRKGDNFLLLTDTRNHGVYIMDIESRTAEKLSVTTTNPIAFDYDPVGGKMYWTDVELEIIKSANLDGTEEKWLYKLPSGSVPDGIAVDPVSRLLFYTDTGNDIISVMTLDGTDRATIIRSGLKEPRAIVLDTDKGIMYWTDWGLPAIERASYDGNNRQKIITTDLQWPNGLAIDTQANKLYWADGGLDKIVSSNIDGTGRRTLYTGTSDSHLFGITILGNFAFFTDWNQKSVMRLDITQTDSSSKFGPEQFGRLNGIAAYKSNNKIATNGCTINRGGCTNLCIPEQNGQTKCLCPDGTNLQPDRKSCA